MIVIAPDSFKGTLTATQVCEIVKDAFLKAECDTDIRCFPIADGGEGTVDALLYNGGERIKTTVKGPFFNDVEAELGILPDNTAVIEMAAASGLPLVGDNKNPLLTTTYGTGQLIKKALDCGCKKIIIGIGGSATNDGGIGCAAALGVKFTDMYGYEVPLCGKGLCGIAKIDMSGLDIRLADVEIKVLCDVVSPLYGSDGAAYVFAPQKGADENMVKALDSGLVNLAEVTEKMIGKDLSAMDGAGAAGGLGFGLVAFLGAKLCEGAPTILKVMGFDKLVKKAKLVITGEGCMDSQSLLGKAPAQVAKMSCGVPVIAVVGMNKVADASGIGIRKIYESNYRKRTFDEVKIHCREDLAEVAQTAADEWKNIFSNQCF